jgi:IMP cyclohydrolase
VTNGDQTNTIYDFMSATIFPASALKPRSNTRTFEDDGPNWTPRISGVVDMRTWRLQAEHFEER